MKVLTSIFIFRHVVLSVLPAVGLVLLLQLAFLPWAPGYKAYFPETMVIYILVMRLYLPQLLPLWVIFPVIVIHDLVYQLPLGLNQFWFIAAKVIITKQQRYLSRNHTLIVMAYLGLMLISYQLFWWMVLAKFSLSTLAQLVVSFFSGLIVMWCMVRYARWRIHKTLPDHYGEPIRRGFNDGNKK